MTEENINSLENNKLIAGFMRFTLERNLGWYDDKEMLSNTYNQSGANCFNEKDLLFSESWDWLMPVVNECRVISHSEDENWEGVVYSVADGDFDKTYAAIITLIKAYNERCFID